MSGESDQNEETEPEEEESDTYEAIQTQGRWMLHLKAHGIVLAIVIVSELIGTQTFEVGPGTVVILPMLFAVVFGILVSYQLLGSYVESWRQVVPASSSEIAAPLLIISLMPLGVKYGTLVGPAFYDIISAGPAFVLQELGNLGTIFLSLPFALLLGLKREAVGATVSIAREPTLGIITDLYGPDSPEGIGVLGTYLTGTMLGTLFFGLLGGFATVTPLHPKALAMGCGIGSASMMTACSGSLATVVPGMEDTVLAYAATSNLLTGFSGVYAVLFLAVPLVNFLYRTLFPILGRGE